MSMTEAINELYKKTEIAYDNSEIKKLALLNNQEWYYSISSSKLFENCFLLVGFNWGVDRTDTHLKQESDPKKTFSEIIPELASFKRVVGLLKKYLPNVNLDEYVQTNFCFFRSEEESQISNIDLVNSSKLFIELLEILKPKIILAFSMRLRDYFLEKNGLFNVESKTKFKSGKRNILIVKGTYDINGRKVPVFLLPHPNSKLSSDARRAAWEFCFPVN